MIMTLADIGITKISTGDNKRDVKGFIEAGTKEHIIELRNSIENNSYIAERIITLCPTNDFNNFEFLVVEGNHRILALKAMFGHLTDLEIERFLLSDEISALKSRLHREADLYKSVPVQIISDQEKLKFIVKEAHTNTTKKEFQPLAQIKDRIDTRAPKNSDKEIIAFLNYVLTYVLDKDTVRKSYTKIYRKPTILPKIFLKNEISYNSKKFKFENVLAIISDEKITMDTPQNPFNLAVNYSLISKTNNNELFFEKIESLSPIIALLVERYCKNALNLFVENENNLPKDDKTSLDDLEEFDELFENILDENPRFKKYISELADSKETTDLKTRTNLNRAVKKINSKSSDHTLDIIYQIAKSSKRMIFISHASEDKVIGDAVKSILVNIFKINESNIFYSSDCNENPTLKFVRMRSFLRNPENLIVMIGTGFYVTKEWPLFELGAAWVNFESTNKFVLTTNFNHIKDFQIPFSLNDSESINIEEYHKNDEKFRKFVSLIFDLVDCFNKPLQVNRNDADLITKIHNAWMEIDFDEYNKVIRLGDKKKKEFDKISDKKYLIDLVNSEDLYHE